MPLLCSKSRNSVPSQVEQTPALTVAWRAPQDLALLHSPPWALNSSTRASQLFVRRGRHASASGIPHWLFPLPVMIFFQNSTWLTSLPPSYHLIMRPILTQFKTATLSLILVTLYSSFFPCRLLPSNNLKCLLIYNAYGLLSAPPLEKVLWRRDLSLSFSPTYSKYLEQRKHLLNWVNNICWNICWME